MPVNSWDVGTGGYLRDVECGCERAKRGSRRAYRAPRARCTGRNSLVEMNLAAIGFERRGKRPQTAGVVVRSGARALELNDAQIWNAVKVAHVGGPDRVAQFQGASSNDEISHGKSDSFRGLFGSDPADNLGGRFGDWMNGDVRFDLVEKLATHPAQLRCVGAVDAVSELRDGHRTDDDGHVAGGFADPADYIRRGELFALGCNQDAGIEH